MRTDPSARQSIPPRGRLAFVGKGRRRRQGLALGLEFFEDVLDALVELLVLAAEFAGGVVVDEDVGFDPFALYQRLLIIRL
jgi:hypothetical protein